MPTTWIRQTNFNRELTRPDENMARTAGGKPVGKQPIKVKIKIYDSNLLRYNLLLPSPLIPDLNKNNISSCLTDHKSLFTNLNYLLILHSVFQIWN